MIGQVLTAGGIIPFVAFSSPVCHLLDHEQLFVGKLAPLLGKRKISTDTLQITYGAMILSFLGGPHWRITFTQYNSISPLTRVVRLGWGVVPSLMAWPLANAEKNIAIDGICAGLATAFTVDGCFRAMGLLPNSYFRLRVPPTAMAVICLQSNHKRWL